MPVVQVARDIGPHDRVVFCTHEPDWVLNAFEGQSAAVNLRYVGNVAVFVRCTAADYVHPQSRARVDGHRHLMHRTLRDRVALRLAGDLHHYSRYEPRQRAVPRAPSSPVTSTPALRTPARATAAGPWSPNFDMRRPTSNPDAGRRRRRRRRGRTASGAPSPAHPANGSSSGTASVNAGVTAAAGVGAGAGPEAGAGAAPPQPPRLRPALIVSGGGGAFLHPTNLFAGQELHVDEHPYDHVLPALRTAPHGGMVDADGCCMLMGRYRKASSYPSEGTSRRYALLNIFGFRRRNWRFDVIGGIAYSLLMISMMGSCRCVRGRAATSSDRATLPRSPDVCRVAALSGVRIAAVWQVDVER